MIYCENFSIITMVSDIGKHGLTISHMNFSCPVSARVLPTIRAFPYTSTRNQVLSTGLNVWLIRVHASQETIYGGKGRLLQKDPETLPYHNHSVHEDSGASPDDRQAKPKSSQNAVWDGCCSPANKKEIKVSGSSNSCTRKSQHCRSSKPGTRPLSHA